MGHAMHFKSPILRKVLCIIGMIYALLASAAGTAAVGQGSLIGTIAATIGSVGVDTRNDSVLYAPSEVGIYKSLDRGVTWTKQGTGLPVTLSSLLNSPSDSSILFAGSNSQSTPVVYKTVDGGDHWDATDLHENSQIIQNPTSPNEFNALPEYKQGFYKSTNNGLNWSPLTQFPATGSVVFH